MVGKVEEGWTLMVVGAGVVAARTAIEVAAAEAVGVDWGKPMLRSTGVMAAAACMVYLAISRLQVRTLGKGSLGGEGLRGYGGK